MKTHFVLAALVIILSLSTAYYYQETKTLRREQEAHGWRYFSCMTLINDPQYLPVLCVKKFKKHK